MFRCGIRILVVVGLLASQSVAVPHAHTGLSFEEQRQHDATAHIHLGGSGQHHHGHSHCHGGLSHGGHAHRHESPVQQRSSETLPGGFRDQGHHDASSLALPNLAAARTTGDKTSPASNCLAMTLVPAVGCDSFADTACKMASRLGRPPDIVLDASDTYLKLRNLRI